MFVAQLSALDLGKLARGQVTPKGCKYTRGVQGVITEVFHNYYGGYTKIRLAPGNMETSTQEAESMIANGEGVAYTVRYGELIDVTELGEATSS